MTQIEIECRQSLYVAAVAWLRREEAQLHALHEWWFRQRLTVWLWPPPGPQDEMVSNRLRRPKV